MDLILWRHAEAEEPRDGESDLERALTHRGEKQAARMAVWLDRQLPQGTRIVCSPARRTEQTVLALGRKYKLREELSPHASSADLLELVQWPQNKAAVLVVGHQPTLGHVISQLLGLSEPECQIRKGAVWWLRHRVREDAGRTAIVAVQSPDSL